MLFYVNRGIARNMPVSDGESVQKEGEIMRGLLYNQLRTFQFPLFCIFVMQLFFLIVTVTLNENQYSVDFGLNACMIMPFMLFLLVNSELFRQSGSEKWSNFAISTPTAVKGQVAVKYIFTLIVHAAILLFGVLSCLIMTLITGENLFSHLQIGLIFFGISLILNSADFPFYFRFGSENGSRVKAASILVVIVLVLIYGLFGDVSFLFGKTTAQDLLNFMNSPPIKLITWLIPTFSVILFFVSFVISLPLYRKGLERE